MSSARSRGCWPHAPRPIALPTEPATPDANALPGQPAPRPLAGPILPLVASSVGTDQLLGGPGSRPAAVDALAARTMVKGEPLAPPAGRADDFAWPRREIGREQAKGETPIATVAPDGTVAAPGRAAEAEKASSIGHAVTAELFRLSATRRASYRRRRVRRAFRARRPMSGDRRRYRAFSRGNIQRSSHFRAHLRVRDELGPMDASPESRSRDFSIPGLRAWARIPGMTSLGAQP